MSGSFLLLICPPQLRDGSTSGCVPSCRLSACLCVCIFPHIEELASGFKENCFIELCYYRNVSPFLGVLIVCCSALLSLMNKRPNTDGGTSH